MSFDSVLAIILTVVLSILANLATPWVGQQIAARRDGRTAADAARRARRDAQTRHFFEHPETFTQYLLRSTLDIAGLGFTSVLLVTWLLVTIQDRPVPSVAFAQVQAALNASFTIAAAVFLAVALTILVRRLLAAADFYRAVRRLRVEAGTWPEDWKL